MPIREALNARILVIDDEESVRDSFAAVLGPRRPATSEVGAAAAALFGDAPTPASESDLLAFDLELAASGAEGIAQVAAAMAAGRPFAAVFCDLRMPSLDGPATIEHIRALDERVEVVFMTAYSDQGVAAIGRRAGGDVGYFVKPFLSEEVKQLATKLVLDWNKARELEQLMTRISALQGSTEDVEWLVRFLLKQMCAWLGTTSAALLRMDAEGEVTSHIGVGALEDFAAAEALYRSAQGAVGPPPSGTGPGIRPGTEPGAEPGARQGSDTGAGWASLLPTADRTSVDGPGPAGRSGQTPGEARPAAFFTVGNNSFFRLRDVGVALAAAGDQVITPDRRFLVQVFLEHASLAIRHAEARRKLVETERMAAVGQSVGFIMHDLRNPLAVAKMYARALRTEMPGLGRPEQVLQRVEASIDQALAMLNDILLFVRGEEKLQSEAIDVAAALAGLEDEWKWVLAQRDIGLRLELPAGVRAVIDAGRIRRVIGNLIRNAAEALKQGGVIAVTAEVSRGTLCIGVADDGPGIPEAVIPNLFRPFAAKDGTGAGFGLAIVRQIVEAHGGTVEVETGPAGTRFILRMPAGL